MEAMIVVQREGQPVMTRQSVGSSLKVCKAHVARNTAVLLQQDFASAVWTYTTNDGWPTHRLTYRDANGKRLLRAEITVLKGDDK